MPDGPTCQKSLMGHFPEPRCAHQHEHGQIADFNFELCKSGRMLSRSSMNMPQGGGSVAQSPSLVSTCPAPVCPSHRSNGPCVRVSDDMVGSAKSRHHTAIALASVLTRCASTLDHLEAEHSAGLKALRERVDLARRAS